MPELPEVETTRRGIAPHIEGRRIVRVVVRDGRLRQPVPRRINQLASGQIIRAVSRRGKYLLLEAAAGSLMIHLGMSGSLRLLPAGTAAEKHDHVDVVLADGRCLRLRDPRRFGLLLWLTEDPALHPLLKKLGPEPLESTFSAAYLSERARGRMLAVKPFLMDAQVVVGVGNIYANEALFSAAIHPRRAAGDLSRDDCRRLVKSIKEVLRCAIAQGGTTLRDFVAGDGRPGYFKQQLKVYDREGAPCLVCGGVITCERLSQRATYFCGCCQC